MGAMASQTTSVYSGGDQGKHQSSESLAFVRGIHRRPVNSPHKWPVTRKMFPFDDVIMKLCVDNYRGLMISICVGKLFTKILTKRILNSWEKMAHQNLINVVSRQTSIPKTNFSFHISFMRNISTQRIKRSMRHLLIFQNSLMKSNGNTYYARYSDTTSLDRWKMHSIIKRMYSNPSYQILISGNPSPKLSASLGVNW